VPEEQSGDFRSTDGRTVFFSRYGVDGGRPVVFHSGTPGTRHLGPRIIRAIGRHQVDLLVMDRPGYGGSTRWPGRCIADVVVDVAVLADLHGWDTFAVWGGSGGGPHALACAALLPDRVLRCASVVGPAPYGADDLDWLAGMSPGNVEEFTLALRGEESYRPLVERLAQEAVDLATAGEVPIPDDYELPEADINKLRERLAEPGFVDRIVAAHRDGVDGWIDDCIAAISPWGYDPTEMERPVGIFYGPDDVLVPATHAEWLLSHIPGAERHELPSGHMLSDDDLDAVYEWLLAEK
jgi:pimeloyl-ACP methyl ester carboxylesterase